MPESRPGIEELMSDVRRLRLRARRRVDDLLAGEYHSAFKGQGVEFAEVREYEPGDDIRSIDWNVTARTGKPFIKRFEEERQLTVTLVVDVSASGVFGGPRGTGRLIAEAAAVLAVAAQRNGDRVALLLYSDEVELFLPPRKGANALLRILREVLGTRPHGAGTAAAEAFRTLERVLKRRAVVFVAGDWLTPLAAEPWEVPLRRLARRHDVIALRASDPAQRALPRLGLVELQDPETGRTMLADTGSAAFRARHDREARAAGEQSARTIRRCGVDLVELSTTRAAADDIERYFRLRERRRRVHA